MDGSISGEIAVIVVCIVLSGLFTLTESAAKQLHIIGLKQLAASKEQTSTILNFLLQNITRIMYTVIFVRIVTFAGMLIFTSYMHVEKGRFTAMLICSACFLVFAYLVPITVARYKAEAIIVPCAYISKVFYYVLYPVSWAMDIFARLMAKVFGFDEVPRTFTKEDLAFLIDVSEEQGLIEEEKQEMLSNIFEISDINVKSVMTPRTDMVAISKDADKEDFLNIIDEAEYSRIPVYDDTLDQIIGVIYVKDMIHLMRGEWSMADVFAGLHEVLFVPETKKIYDMLKEFQSSRCHMAVVIDEYGGVEGIVTLEDVLEEIVGDIWDEFDDEHEEKEIDDVGGGCYIVDSRTDIDDLYDFFGIPRIDTEYETVGGLVYDIAGAVPSEGDSFSWHNFTITVKSMDNNKLDKIEFTRKETNEIQEAS